MSDDTIETPLFWPNPKKMGGGGVAGKNWVYFAFWLNTPFWLQIRASKQKKLQVQQCNVLRAPYVNCIRVSDKRMYDQRSIEMVMGLASRQNRLGPP